MDRALVNLGDISVIFSETNLVRYSEVLNIIVRTALVPLGSIVSSGVCNLNERSLSLSKQDIRYVGK